MPQTILKNNAAFFIIKDNTNHYFQSP